MRPIRIFVDSTADLSPELIAKYDLTVIPLYVTIGGKAYKDMYEIKAQDIFETSEADWDFIIQTNLKSLFLMCKSAMEIMREQKSGRIINMSSIVAYRGALFGRFAR